MKGAWELAEVLLEEAADCVLWCKPGSLYNRPSTLRDLSYANKVTAELVSTTQKSPC